jgi:hypothetical protein
MDDSSMVLIEIGVYVDEGVHPILMIQHGIIPGPSEAISRVGDEDATTTNVVVDLQASH